MAENKEKNEIDKKEKDMKGFKRFITFNTLNGSEHEEYFEPKVDPGEYVVDDSSFIPMEEAIKQLKDSGLTAEEIQQSYDFPNGIDSGIEIPISRSADFNDIAEISHEIMNQANELSEKIKSEKDFQKKQKAFESAVNQIKNNNTKTE